MQLSALVHLPLGRPRRASRRRPAAAAPTAPAPTTSVADAPARPRDTATRAKHARARDRRSGGPEDVALYTCSCGYVFTADVTASVPCPHCGTTQAW